MRRVFARSDGRPAQTLSAQVARRFDIRCRICPQIGDEFPPRLAKFSPSQCLEVSSGAHRCDHNRGVVRGSRACGTAKCRAQICHRLGGNGPLEKRSGQAPRGPKMKERSSRRPAAKRGNATVGPQQNPASGGVPARASNVRPNTLPFIPDQRSFGGDTGLSAAICAASHSRHVTRA